MHLARRHNRAKRSDTLTDDGWIPQIEKHPQTKNPATMFRKATITKIDAEYIYVRGRQLSEVMRRMTAVVARAGCRVAIQ